MVGLATCPWAAQAQVFGADAAVVDFPDSAFVDLEPVDGTAVATVDGVPVFSKENVEKGPFPQSLVHVEVAFAAPQTTFAVAVHTTQVGGSPFLAGVAFWDSADPEGFAVWPGDSSLGALAPGASRTFEFRLGGAGDLGLRDFGHPGAHDRVSLTFELPASNDVLGLDAVALVPPLFSDGFESGDSSRWSG